MQMSIITSHVCSSSSAALFHSTEAQSIGVLNPRLSTPLSPPHMMSIRHFILFLAVEQNIHRL